MRAIDGDHLRITVFLGLTPAGMAVDGMQRAGVPGHRAHTPPLARGSIDFASWTPDGFPLTVIAQRHVSNFFNASTLATHQAEKNGL